MKRLALQELVLWKDKQNRKPMIVWGARQVGKTYLVKELFAKRYFKDYYLYIDCKIEDEIRHFCDDTANADKIIEYISLLKGKKIDSKTLLIFDEVQECPNIISALKYFSQDHPEIPDIFLPGSQTDPCYRHRIDGADQAAKRSQQARRNERSFSFSGRQDQSDNHLSVDF